MTRKPKPLGQTAAVWLLGILPTPDELRAAIETLEVCASVRRQAAEAFAPAIEELKACLEDAERATDSLLLAVHKRLEETGSGELIVAEDPRLWIEFDPETKQPQLRQVGKTGRPTNVYNEWIANRAEWIASRDTGGPPEPKDKKLREQVAHALQYLVPPELLDTSSDGKMYHLIVNRNNKRRRLVRKIEEHAPSEEEVKQLIRRAGLPIATGAWRSTRWLYLLEALLVHAKSEAAGDGPAKP